MKELFRTNDVVKLSWIKALLRDSGIEVRILDSYTSILEGSAGAIPRRLVVDDRDHARAVQVLKDAGEGLEVE